MASYQPQSQLRQVAVDPHQTALLFVDVQNFNCHKDGATYAQYSKEELEGPEFAYWWSRIDECLDKWHQLRQAARDVGIEVLYIVIQQQTSNGRDRSLDYKISGFNVPPGCWDAQVLSSLQPGPDEVVLPKTTSSVFNSTTLDYLLRNMDKKFLILAGCLTDQCVAHAVMDAADLGYLVTMVTDCCATYTPERHAAACQAMSGYCRQRTLDELLTELNTLPPGPTAAAAAAAAAAAPAAVTTAMLAGAPRVATSSSSTQTEAPEASPHTVAPGDQGVPGSTRSHSTAAAAAAAGSSTVSHAPPPPAAAAAAAPKLRFAGLFKKVGGKSSKKQQK